MKVIGSHREEGLEGDGAEATVRPDHGGVWLRILRLRTRRAADRLRGSRGLVRLGTAVKFLRQYSMTIGSVGGRSGESDRAPAPSHQPIHALSRAPSTTGKN